MPFNQLKRREVITLLGGAIANWPMAARGQGVGIKRLGILLGGGQADLPITDKEVLEGLAQLGWTEGKNLLVDYRVVGSNNPAIIRPHAEALLRAAPDVIFTSPATGVQVLRRLTSKIPIVFYQNADPVRSGAVQSLARPGGNVTGFVGFEPSINTKFLQLLKDVAPQMARVGVLQTEASAFRGDFSVIQTASRSIGVEAIALIVRDDPADIERAVVAFAREPDGGIIQPPDTAITKHRALIAELALKHRLPTISSARLNVEAGGLLYYYAAPLDRQHLASYLDRILRGAKPGDLPVETPTKFELGVNLTTAKALGLTISHDFLLNADEVIE